MANSALVCKTSTNVCTTTIFSVSDKKSGNKSTWKKKKISGVEGFQVSLLMEGISSNAAKVVSHSRKKAQQLIKNQPGVSGLAGTMKKK